MQIPRIRITMRQEPYPRKYRADVMRRHSRAWAQSVLEGDQSPLLNLRGIKLGDVRGEGLSEVDREQLISLLSGVLSMIVKSNDPYQLATWLEDSREINGKIKIERVSANPINVQAGPESVVGAAASLVGGDAIPLAAAAEAQPVAQASVAEVENSCPPLPEPVLPPIFSYQPSIAHKVTKAILLAAGVCGVGTLFVIPLVGMGSLAVIAVLYLYNEITNYFYEEQALAHHINNRDGAGIISISNFFGEAAQIRIVAEIIAAGYGDGVPIVRNRVEWIDYQARREIANILQKYLARQGMRDITVYGRIFDTESGEEVFWASRKTVCRFYFIDRSVDPPNVPLLDLKRG